MILRIIPLTFCPSFNVDWLACLLPFSWIFQTLCSRQVREKAMRWASEKAFTQAEMGVQYSVFHALVTSHFPVCLLSVTRTIFSHSWPCPSSPSLVEHRPTGCWNPQALGFGNSIPECLPFEDIPCWSRPRRGREREMASKKKEPKDSITFLVVSQKSDIEGVRAFQTQATTFTACCPT